MQNDSDDVIAVVSAVTVEALKNMLKILNNFYSGGGDPGGQMEKDVSAINSAIIKLEKMGEKFSLEECRVIYWALGDFRDLISQMLDAEKDQASKDVFIEDSRKVNAVMRFWRQFLTSSEEGRAVLELFA